MRFAVVAMLFCVAMPVVATAEVKATPQVNMRGVLQIVLSADGLVAKCDLPAEQNAALSGFHEKLWIDVLDALDRRAKAIHPEMGNDERLAARDAYFDQANSDIARMLSSQQGCAAMQPEALTKLVVSIDMDELRQAVRDYGTAALHYDTQFPVAKWPEAMSYASPQQQQSLVPAIQMHLEEAGCEAPELAGIELSDKAVKPATNLPVFIAPPIRYNEMWKFECAEGDAQLDVSFAADSDGPIGTYTVSGPAE